MQESKENYPITGLLKKGDAKMEQVLQFLKDANVFYVATVDGDRP